MKPRVSANRRARRPERRARRATVPVEPLRFIEPMKARLQSALPTGREWLYEVKLDGIRALGIKNGPEVKLFSRKPRDMTAEFPDIVSALRRLPAQRFMVDGEISALDAHGRPSFQLLQRRQGLSSNEIPLRYFLFDLLQVNQYDLKGLALVERRKALEDLLRSARGPLGLSTALTGSAERIWKRIVALGLEGVIAKQAHSSYEPGCRSGAWVKVKALAEQEFIIGGYTPPEGARKYFGAILVGFYDRARLRYASKVGTGFDDATLRALFQLFQKHRAMACPFVDFPGKRAGRFGQGWTAARVRACTWLRPVLVCQVRFQEWTAEGGLRQPVFVGMREDKRARDVKRERTAGANVSGEASASGSGRARRRRRVC